jgi:hypothetical protein
MRDNGAKPRHSLFSVYLIAPGGTASPQSGWTNHEVARSATAGPKQGQDQGSGSFLKKRTKKLLFFRATGAVGANAHDPISKVFLLLFVHKKKRLLTSFHSLLYHPGP